MRTWEAEKGSGVMGYGYFGLACTLVFGLAQHYSRTEQGKERDAYMNDSMSMMQYAYCACLNHGQVAADW